MWDWLLFLLLGSGHIPYLKASDKRYACDLGERAPRRDPYYYGKKTAIVLLESDQLQHKLMNAVLGILFREKLGYTNITTKKPRNEDFDTIVSYYFPESGSRRSNEDFPQVLINVGMELPAGAPPGQVERAVVIGGVGTTRRHRWYMHPAPDATEDCAFALYLKFYAQPQRMAECFKNKTLVQPSDQLFNRCEISENRCTSGYPCPVVLFPFYYKNETDFLTQHFENLNLNLAFIFVGDQFYSVVKKLKERNETFLIVDEILWKGFDEILTLGCKNASTYNDNSKQTFCPYNIKWQTKSVWDRTYEVFPTIYNTLQFWTMNDKQISHLTQRFRLNSSAVVETAACEWMRSSPEVVKTWIQYVNTKPIIVLYAIFCEEDISRNILKDVSKFTANYINHYITNNTYTLHVNVQIFPCSLFAFSSSVKKIYDISMADNFMQTAGIIVPSIYQALDMMAGLSKVLRTPFITFSPNGPSFVDRDKYPHVFRTVGEKVNLKKAYIEFFNQYNWKRVAAISGYNQSNVDFITQLEEHFHRNDQKFRSVKITEEFSVRKCLEDLYSKKARIILVDVEESQAAALFLAAHDLRMFPSEGFVWLLPDWTRSFHNSIKDMSYETQDKIKQVLNGHFSLTFSSIGSGVQNGTVSNFRNELLKSVTEITEDDSAVGFVVDAIWTLTQAAHKLIVQKPGAENDIHSDITVSLLSHFIQENSFEGVSGKIEFYNGSVKISHIKVKRWTTNGPKLIAEITVDAAKDKTEWLQIDNIINWETENNKKPDDGTIRCIFRETPDFNPTCNDGFIIGGISLIALIITIFAIYSVICFKRHKKETKMLLDSLNNTRLDLTNRLPGYEVPRDNIELTWEIGKGSFGKVFGGYLKMDDDSWSQVAIKLLKCDASAEDENDFLYEAKTMASFDHKNIVKLMAVCTSGTPILIVMELMLHEDLKKFLVTKRHLVCDPDCAQMKCITPQGLTKMALDVAMGLSYLATKKFVHRDIASRNCMVNVHGVVKLGDFGMARYVFSKGEYLCQRRALFPVRWMAPESLSKGTFTSMSDVWSYGVLIYEIITFGGTPYSSIRDSSQVKDFVVNGNIIRLPNIINPQLKWLIEQCWSYDDSHRPSAADVVVYLADHPSLLHACLDSSLERYHCDRRAVDTGGSGGTPTVHVNAVPSCDTGTSTIDYAIIHERKDSGYEENPEKDSSHIMLT